MGWLENRDPAQVEAEWASMRENLDVWQRVFAYVAEERDEYQREARALREQILEAEMLPAVPYRDGAGRRLRAELYLRQALEYAPDEHGYRHRAIPPAWPFGTHQR